MSALLVSLIILCSSAHHPESYYQKAWCAQHNGQIEYVLDDGTRVDCLTCEYAIEFDFAPKWAEAIGQALYYALKTNRKPAIVLICEDPAKDLKYLTRLQSVAGQYKITIWVIPSTASQNQ